MKRLTLLLLAALPLFAAIDHFNIPIRINDQVPPQVVSIDVNLDSVKSRGDRVVDTVNKVRDSVAYYLYSSGGYTGTGTLVRSASPTLTGTAAIANAVFSGSLTMSTLTASLPVFTDGSKTFVSNAVTGSGNVVMSSSPTITSPTISGGTVNATTLQKGGVNVPTVSETATLTNKTIALGSNTMSGTTAQFNTALTDGDFATLAGSETLTNKSISASQITAGTFGAGAYVFPQKITINNSSGTSELAINRPSNSYGSNLLLLNASTAKWAIQMRAGNNDFHIYDSDINSTRLRIDETTGATDIYENLQLRSNVRSLNKLETDWVTWATRNTAGSETIIDLTNIGNISFSGSILSGSVPAARVTAGTLGAGNYAITGDLSATGTITQNGAPVVTTTGSQTLTNKSIIASQITAGTFAAGNYAMPGKLALNGATSDSTLAVTGSLRASGNAEIGGKLELGGNEAFDYDEGSFTLDVHISAPGEHTGTANFVRVGKKVTILTPAVTQFGNPGVFVLDCSGLPASIRPSATVVSAGVNVYNDTSWKPAHCFISPDGTMDCYQSGGSFVDDVTLGFNVRTSIEYMLP